MQKPTRGKLDIELTRGDTIVYIKICDDGTGRKRSSEKKLPPTPLHKSMGLQITAERIALLRGYSFVDILDLVDSNGEPAGTEVTIKIPVIYD